MNHFLLGVQSDSSKDKYGESARYGAYAMEELINKVLTQGSGQRTELEIKVFGGGNINQKKWMMLVQKKCSLCARLPRGRRL